MQIPTTMTAKTLPEAWWFCIHGLLGTTLPNKSAGTHKYTIDRGSFEGHQRIEYDYITIRVEYPWSRPLVPDAPQGVPTPTTQEYVESYLPYLLCGVKGDQEQYTYGEYLEKQIPQIIEMYKKDGHNTNQAIMAVGDADSIKLSDPPCLRLIDTRIQNDKLHFFVYFRSWDLWSGFPANLAAIQILKEYMADEIGVGDGELIASSKGLHLYDHCWEYAKAVLRR